MLDLTPKSKKENTENHNCFDENGGLDPARLRGIGKYAGAGAGAGDQGHDRSGVPFARAFFTPVISGIDGFPRYMSKLDS